MVYLVRNAALSFLILSTLTLGGLATAADILNPGESMSNGQYIRSPNGQYTLIMQSDGSLVMYRANGTVRYRMKKHGSHAIMQTDGNFVEYIRGTAIWSTGTPTSPGYWLKIYDNGDLKVEWNTRSHSMGAVRWSIGADPVGDPSIVSYGMTAVPPPGKPPKCPLRSDYIPPPGC